MDSSSLTSILHSGQRARLIPIVKDSKKEEKATSSLLATFRIVPSFVQAVLSNVGVSVSKRSQVTCYTEVSFDNKDKKFPRPDGLIIVSTGNKTWSAIVESKIGTSELKQDQIEEYIDLAKTLGIDAVITISNQFATTPTHHPVKVPKQKLKHVQLYHFSWLFLESSAILLNENKGVTDPEQAFILSELIRYLQHEESGVSSFTKMSKGWKEVCEQIHEGRKLKKGDEDVENSVASWQQLLRYLAIKLSIELGKIVNLYLSRSRSNDPLLNFNENIDELIQKNRLTAEFEIPNAASRLKINIDFLRRTLNLSMYLDSPKDKKIATASINWLLRQLNHLQESDIIITVYWPKRIAPTSERLSVIFEDVNCLAPQYAKEMPLSFEVKQVYDLASKFKGAVSFVDIISKALPEFYENVGQHLNKWVAKPPKIKRTEHKIDDDKKEEVTNPFWMPQINNNN